MEKVSVIVPVYNAELTIERCLKSIINQSYKNLEIICIDDGSKDNSNLILQRYWKLDNRIIVINKENAGVSSARNTGLKISTGQYILFVDADDYLMNNMIERLVNTIKKDNSELAICNYYIKNDVKTEKHKFSYSDSKYEKKEFLEKFDRYFENVLINQPWNKLYLKSKIKTYFCEEISLGEDLVFNINYINEINHVSYVNSCLYVYDTTLQNSLTKLNHHKPKDFFELYSNVYKDIYYQNDIKVSAKMNFCVLKHYIHILNEDYNNTTKRIGKFRIMVDKYSIFIEFIKKQRCNSKIEKIIFSKFIYSVIALLYCLLK